jgi:hypothetical protein
MNTITASIILLVGGIAIGFAIYPNPTFPDPIHPDVIPREQALDDHSCGELADEEHLLRVISHDWNAVLLPECGTAAQRRTTAYLCGEIDHEERVQRRIFDDRDAVPLPECQSGGIVPGWPNFLAWFFGPSLLAAWFLGRSKVGSFDQPKSLASTP